MASIRRINPKRGFKILTESRITSVGWYTATGGLVFTVSLVERADGEVKSHHSLRLSMAETEDLIARLSNSLALAKEAGHEF